MIYLESAVLMQYIYIAIVVIVVIALAILLIVLMKRKPKEEPLNLAYAEKLYLALGEKKNIKSIEMTQKRLQIEFIDIKGVDQKLLKEIETPAFLTGKKITLLVKSHTHEIHSYLNEKRKEAK